MQRILLLALLILAVPALTLSQVTKDEPKKMPGKTDVEKSLIKLDRDLIDAMVRKDRATADKVELSNYLFVNPGGGVEIKGQQMGTGPIIDSVDTSDEVVHVHDNMAVLTGKAMLKGRFADGPDISGPYRYMRVFVKQQGDWRLAATSVTPIKPLGPNTATTPKN